MIIDFHTHVFPDKIASKTISLLAEKADITPFSDGSVMGLINAMNDGGIDVSITLPVVTNPKQFDSVLTFAKSLNESEFSDKIISFAGIHPDCENVREKLTIIKENGFKGIKVHPDYQNTYFNDDKYVEIFKYAKDLDLIVVTHAGVDYGYKDQPVKCTPDTVIDVLRKVGEFKLVLAHFGGHCCFDEVYDKLAGKNVYFDTSYILKETPKDCFVKILEKHGADKVLFATDSPWSSMKKDVETLKSFSLGRENEDAIFYKNAKKLLGI